ncbi:MAG TPA: hypothetical protein GXX75_25660 [Clostridiales bacterium]|nr:hypothetical protein [Clostridiales bacterium]
MDLMRAIKNFDICEAEKIIKEQLEHRPEDIQLWFKLSLAELQYPLKDYIGALKCVDEIYKLSRNNLDALILESGIKWHNRFIDDELFERLSKAKTGNKNKQAIIYYLQSLYYRVKEDIENQKICLEKSIMLCNEFVYPYEALGYILLSESKINESKKMFQNAFLNVKKVYQADDLFDFTDLDVYVEEFITGTTISELNYNFIRELAQDWKVAGY